MDENRNLNTQAGTTSTSQAALGSTSQTGMASTPQASAAGTASTAGEQLPADVFQDAVFEVRAMGMQTLIQKQARIVEEIVIGKQVEQHTETIQETVRVTDVQVEELPGSMQQTNYQEVAHVTAGQGVAGSVTSSGSSMQTGASTADTMAPSSDVLDLDRTAGTGRRGGTEV